MKPDLEPVRTILLSFLSEMESVKGFRIGFSSPSTTDKDSVIDTRGFEFGSDLYWEKEDAYSWLHAEATHFRSLLHRPKTNTIPEYYRQPALPVYQQWRSQEKEIFHRGRLIPPPEGNVQLREYLQHSDMEAILNKRKSITEK